MAMNKILAALATILASAASAGCNVIVSPTPLFFPKDSAGQAQLRPGVWTDERKGCDFDAGQPIDKWPDCANVWVVRPGEIVGTKDRGTDKATTARYPTVLAKGDPAVLQIGDTNDPDSKLYLFLGIRPLKTDTQGRIVEFKAWPTLCGPPPTQDPNGKAVSSLSPKMIEGLTPDDKQQDCIAHDQRPVRIAARESEAWNGDDQDGRDLSRWVRDGEK
jgi:hypothetical protein